ncbi:tRNA/rRNA methyltransferase SPOU [Sporocytophaga myxococcoides]|uniref:tRNA/rRNA methyltransferase SPOU n=1 Tax=Sporocytophaga myxococcoides TaxID=153721 RepID=A0A098LCB8_9BACT|nr:RNA methyltransferase [Sporocytophaga myxococcoides]GAL84615.1 tRNA/rRNA methyltransferase SPOU [Sporocytophaga myxococcoides]
MKKLKLDELNRLSVDEYKSSDKHPVVLVLDNIRSMHNVGAGFRTGDAFKVEKLYLCGVTARPPHREIHKSALGAEDSVAWEYFAKTSDAIIRLKEEGYIIASVEQAEGSQMLQDFAPDKNAKYAFVFGNEVFGVEEDVVALTDICLEIPQFGTKHSFNVSVTMGIVLWDYAAKVIL